MSRFRKQNTPDCFILSPLCIPAENYSRRLNKDSERERREGDKIKAKKKKEDTASTPEVLLSIHIVTHPFGSVK